MILQEAEARRAMLLELAERADRHAMEAVSRTFAREVGMYWDDAAVAANFFTIARELRARASQEQSS